MDCVFDLVKDGGVNAILHIWLYARVTSSGHEARLSSLLLMVPLLHACPNTIEGKAGTREGNPPASIQH